MTQDPIDMAVFTELQDTMGTEFAQEFSETFLDEAPDMMAELRGAAQDGDADRYRRAAHSMKSNAKVFGAQVLAALARDMELGGIETGTTEGLSALRDASVQAQTALRGLIDG